MILATLYLGARNTVNRVRPPKRQMDNQTRYKEQALAAWRAGASINPDRLLKDCLSYSYERVPFYHQHFKLHKNLDYSQLQHWPVLTRDHIWEHGNEMMALGSARWKTWTHASGGSTGKPVTVVHDELFAGRASALRQLCSEWFFYGPHYNKLILWGMHKEVQDTADKSVSERCRDYLRQCVGMCTTHVNTFEFSHQKLEACVQILRRQKPAFIFGYAGSVYELAKYLDENNIQFPHHVRMVGTTAQTLHDFMRERIERVFRCRVCDHYGSREAGPLAWQHSDGRMYFPQFFSKIEVVDDNDQPVPVGESGRILVTTLHNFSMPLIRYDIGDTGIQGEDVVYAGYPFSTLEKIAGRVSEEFINLRGSRVCGPFFINLFYYRPWLDQFHIVQKDYDLIEIQYVLKAGYGSMPAMDREEIDARIKGVMTDQCTIVWTPVSEVPTTKAGKRLFIRREMQDRAVVQPHPEVAVRPTASGLS